MHVGSCMIAYPLPLPFSSSSRARHPQLVLLDHGLYKELDDDFRLDYCRLWKVGEVTGK